MSLATRCPACSTVFRVVQDQLKVSGGWVRCGHCHEVFNGLAALFELAPAGTRGCAVAIARCSNGLRRHLQMLTGSSPGGSGRPATGPDGWISRIPPTRRPPARRSSWHRSLRKPRHALANSPTRAFDAALQDAGAGNRGRGTHRTGYF